MADYVAGRAAVDCYADRVVSIEGVDVGRLASLDTVDCRLRVEFGVASVTIGFNRVDGVAFVRVVIENSNDLPGFGDVSSVMIRQETTLAEEMVVGATCLFA